MLKSIIAVAVVSVLTGCATAKSPVMGSWYTDVNSSVAPTSNQAGSKVGESCATSILGLIATGDASIEAARKAGGISTVSSVDDYASSILGLYAKYCTRVRGN